MKILLIVPPETRAVYAGYEEAAPCLPPLGLCAVAAVLEEDGHEVRIVDCIAEKLTGDQLLERVASWRPAVCGFSATTIMFNPAREAASRVKALDRPIVTVLGGAHVSALSRETMRENPQFDFGVRGEGEITICELVGKLARGESASDITGLLWRQDGKVYDGGKRPPIPDLDRLPLPARHLLKDLRRYRPPITRAGGSFATSMVTSRGCPVGCAFCDQSVFGRSWRALSAERVMEEMAHLHGEYGVDFITFEDDFFLCSKQRVRELCERIERSGLCIEWGCSVRLDSVDDDTLETMKHAGCRYMFVGIESGSPRILELVDKSQTIESIQRGVHMIKGHGIRVIGSAVIGFPTETKDDIRKTVSLVLSLPLDGLSFFIYTPFPHTPLYTRAQQHGTISDDWQNYSAHPDRLAYVPDGLSEHYLLEVQRKTYLRFFLRPRFILSHLPMMFRREFMKRALKAVFRMTVRILLKRRSDAH